MKIKELIQKLELLNPEKLIEFRAYVNFKENYTDLPISAIRLNKNKIIMSNQCGVE